MHKYVCESMCVCGCVRAPMHVCVEGLCTRMEHALAWQKASHQRWEHVQRSGSESALVKARRLKWLWFTNLFIFASGTRRQWLLLCKLPKSSRLFHAHQHHLFCGFCKIWISIHDGQQQVRAGQDGVHSGHSGGRSSFISLQRVSAAGSRLHRGRLPPCWADLASCRCSRGNYGVAAR